MPKLTDCSCRELHVCTRQTSDFLLMPQRFFFLGHKAEMTFSSGMWLIHSVNYSSGHAKPAAPKKLRSLDFFRITHGCFVGFLRVESIEHFGCEKSDQLRWIRFCPAWNLRPSISQVPVPIVSHVLPVVWSLGVTVWCDICCLFGVILWGTCQENDISIMTWSLVLSFCLELYLNRQALLLTWKCNRKRRTNPDIKKKVKTSCL